MLEELQHQFGAGREIEFRPLHGLPSVVLRHSSGSKAEILLNGGQVVRFRHARRGEVLYTSTKANYIPGKPVRGGIPVIFPQFGAGSMLFHGFARILPWSVIESNVASSGELSVTLALSNDESTAPLWPHEFYVSLTITLDEDLSCVLNVTNQGASNFEFTAGLHSYFAVQSIQQVTIRGLGGLEYYDKVLDRRETEESARLVIDRFLDRLYFNAPNELRIDDMAAGRTILITNRGFADAVIWNPWLEGSPKIADLGPSDYERFVCVEAVAVGRPVPCQPGQTVSFSHTVRVV